MSSGKQVSFQYGEVAPSLRFRSDLASYSNAVSKLKNMYVRKTGGLSNRAGFEFLGVHPNQEKIPSTKGSSGPGIKSVFFKNPTNGVFTYLEYGYVAGMTNAYRFSKAFFVSTLSAVAVIPDDSVEAERVNYTFLKDHVIITPSMEATKDVNGVYRYSTQDIESFANKTFFGFSSMTGTSFGRAPYLPVTYKVTAVMDDGLELDVASFTSGPIADPSTPPGTIVLPHAEMTLSITVNFIGPVTGVKFFNIYRGNGRNATFFKLAGRTRNAGGSSFDFIDYGSESFAENPPEDLTLRGAGSAVLGGVNVASFYQQRLFMAYDVETATNIKSGEIGVSKLGAPEQIVMPTIFNNTAAFQFSVPIVDGSNVVGMLPMERLIVLSEKAAYVIRGGEQGVITPTSVNPVRISETGCSENVQPKMKGNVGIYLSNDHTKIMAVQFGDDGNLGISEMTLLSNHLVVESDIHNIEVVSSETDLAIAVRRDGKLLVGSIGPDFAGFAVWETDGFIENIFTAKDTKKIYAKGKKVIGAGEELLYRKDPLVENIYAYVIRDGVRNIEVIRFRQDDERKGEFFADSYRMFGERLLQTDLGWHRLHHVEHIRSVAMPSSFKTVNNPFPFINSYDPSTGIYSPASARLNIVGGTTWEANEVVEVQSTHVITSPTEGRIFFYYGDEDETKQSKIVFVCTGTGSSTTIDFPYAYEGYFLQDIPSELQDAETQNLPEKLFYQTRFARAFDSVINLTHLANKDVAVMADGLVLSSPNNPDAPTLTVDGSGVLELGDFYAYGYVGLPYESEVETLPIEPSDGRTLSDDRKLINKIGVALDKTRGGFYGPENAVMDNMTPMLADENLVAENGITLNFNGHKSIHVESTWNETGIIKIKQVDPLPMTILAVYPKGASSN